MRHIFWVVAALAAIGVMVSAPAGVGAPSQCPKNYLVMSTVEYPAGASVDDQKAGGNGNGQVCVQQNVKKGAAPKVVDDKAVKG